MTPVVHTSLFRCGISPFLVAVKYRSAVCDKPPRGLGVVSAELPFGRRDSHWSLEIDGPPSTGPPVYAILRTHTKKQSINNETIMGSAHAPVVIASAPCRRQLRLLLYIFTSVFSLENSLTKTSRYTSMIVFSYFYCSPFVPRTLLKSKRCETNSNGS